jgi:pimeloyl-ACP methyl ester carboxylesterase
MRARIVNINGVSTRYFHEGTKGPCVLLIHGVGLSGASWLKNIDPLSQAFQVCAPDLLGSGLTQWTDPPVGPPHPYVLDHLCDLVEHLEWDEFYVVGSSFGALMAALLYLKMPKRVKKLVAISSASFVADDEELAVAKQDSFANGSSAIQSPNLETCRARMHRICFDPQSVPAELVFMQLTEYAMPWALKSYEARMKGMMDVIGCQPYRVNDRSKDLALPTLFLWGIDDTRAPYARAQQMVKELPDARLIAFRQCKHFPHLEHAEKFNEIVTTFLLGQALTAPDVV